MLNIIISILFIHSLALAESLSCPVSSELDDVVEWAKKIDRTVSRKMPESKIKTIFGNPVSEICAGEGGEMRLKILNESLAEAMIQAQKCAEMFHLGDATSVVGILKNTSFDCFAKNEDNRVAESEYINSERPREFRSYRHDYKINLNKSHFNDNLPSTLFHETLHNITTGNRCWHDKAGEKKKNGPDSVYHDRIYFIEAVCFPRSDWGTFYFAEDGDFKNPAVCEKALRETDLGKHDAFYLRGKEAYIGPGYKDKDAKLICQKILTFGKAKALMNARMELNRKRQNMIWDRHIPTAAARKLYSMLVVLGEAYQPNENRAEKKIILEKLAKETLDAADLDTNPTRKKMIKDEVKRILDELKSIDVKTLDYLQKALK